MTLNGEMALNLRYFLSNLVISGAYCVKVVDKAIIWTIYDYCV